jgi:hypothetical protein
LTEGEPLHLHKPKHQVCDRDIFVLVLIVALAVSVNVPGLFQYIDEHVQPPVLRLAGYAAALTSVACIGLFSRRIASRITTWRDDRQVEPES